MKEKNIRISKIILTVVSLVAVFLISGKEILAALVCLIPNSLRSELAKSIPTLEASLAV